MASRIWQWLRHSSSVNVILFVPLTECTASTILPNLPCHTRKVELCRQQNVEFALDTEYSQRCVVHGVQQPWSLAERNTDEIMKVIEEGQQIVLAYAVLRIDGMYGR